MIAEPPRWIVNARSHSALKAFYAEHGIRVFRIALSPAAKPAGFESVLVYPKEPEWLIANGRRLWCG